MTEKFNAIMPKLSPLVRMLSAGTDGEIVSAVRAMLRLLVANQLDIHALAERIEHGDDEKLSASEMQRIYDKGFEDGHSQGIELGRRSVVLAAAQPIGIFATNNDVGDGVNGYSWMQVAQHCAASKQLFHGRDLDFIESMPEKIAAFGRPTEKQAKWLRDLFTRKFGGRI